MIYVVNECPNYNYSPNYNANLFGRDGECLVSCQEVTHTLNILYKDYDILFMILHLFCRSK